MLVLRYILEERVLSALKVSGFSGPYEDKQELDLGAISFLTLRWQNMRTYLS